jgi:hypothetical protein
LKGVHAGVLFVNGSEVSTASHDRLLLVPGSAEAATANTTETREVLAFRLTSAASIASKFICRNSAASLKTSPGLSRTRFMSDEQSFEAGD